MALTFPELNAAIAAIGAAEVYVSDDIADGDSWESIGATDGEVRVEPVYSQNNLTTDRTGGIPHQTLATVESVSVTVPLVLDINLAELYQKFNPMGSSGIGHSRPIRVQGLTIAVVPEIHIGGGLSYAGATPAWARVAGHQTTAATGAEAAPTAAFWLWRGAPQPGAFAFSRENGGKVVYEVTFTGMFDGTKPEGHKVATFGDPIAAGVTTLRISAPPPPP